jgi:hypothetical protein
MKRIAIVIIFIVSSAATLWGESSTPEIRARFSRDSVAIGDQFTLDIEVRKDMMQIVEFPSFELFKSEHPDSPDVEILSESPLDTVTREGRSVVLRKSYLMTIFDEGTYDMGTFPLLYLDKNIVDTLYSADPLIIKVAGFDIDTEKDKIFDIRSPMEVPLKFGEVSGYIAIGLAVALLLAGIIVLIVRYVSGKPIIGRGKPSVPPHVQAIHELEQLHNQKLWQNSKHKLYYTGITDILRRYIAGRFGIQALEMVSEQILGALKSTGEVNEKSLSDMKDILTTADFVKFAKFVPDGEQNEAIYYKSYYFVEETKPTDVEEKEEASVKEVTE